MPDGRTFRGAEALTFVPDILTAGRHDRHKLPNPCEWAYESVTTAVKALASQAVTKINNLAPRLVDRGNVNAPDVQAQINPDVKKYL